MKILFLDDDQSRHDIFKRRSIGCKVDHVYSAKQTIDFLSKTDYDLVMLDHDLGGPESEYQLLDDNDDGRTVCQWFATQTDNTKFLNTIFIIHSLNPAGNNAMNNMLRDCGLTSHSLPFAWKTFNYNNKRVNFNG